MCTSRTPPCSRSGWRRSVDVGTRALPLLSILCLATPAARPAYAAPGDLDPTFAGFGSGGMLLEPGPIPAGMALQRDERIVVVGSTGGAIEVRRYLPNGAPDPLFSGDGIGTYMNPSFAVFGFCVAIQPDGKIVVAGYADAHPAHYVLARLTPTGELDPSFDGDGWATLDFDNDTDIANAVLVQPDGKIVVAGESLIGGDYDFSAARYLPDGALDTSFGGDGKVTVGFGGDDRCKDITLQEDGKLVMVGINSGTIDNDFALARLNSNGTLDGSFDGDGKLSFGFGGNEYATAVAIQPDGKMVVTGPHFGEGRIARLWPNGSLDGSFDGDGKLTNSVNSCEDVAIQPDGKIVVFGRHTSPDGDFQFAFHRMNPDGSLDPTFDGGEAYIDFGPDDFGFNLALLPDGRMIGSGYSSTSPLSIALVRLWPDGTYDVGGQQTNAVDDFTFPAGSDERAYGMAVQSDGKIVVAGTVTHETAAESDFVLARFSTDGQLDGSFGVAGRVVFSFHNLDVARAVAIQPDGKIVVAGHTGDSNVNALVARFNSNGTLDNTFGFGGFNVMDFLGGPDYIYAVAIAPDGKIVVAGSVFNGGTMVFGAGRFNPDGTPDNSFDGDAKQLFAFPGVSTHWASALAVQPDRKVIVGGTADGNFALVRLNENGSVDGGFGAGGTGYTITDMGGPNDFIRALALQWNGWIYGVGGGNNNFALAQYMSNGVLYTCPEPPCIGWQAGKRFADWGGIESAWAVDLRSDQKIVAAGCVNGHLGWAQFTTRAIPGAPLQATTDFVGFMECEESGEVFTLGGAGVKFVGSNGIVAAATQMFEEDRNLALARFETTVNTAALGVGDELSSSIRLHAAFPNPMSRQSVIGFDLPQAQLVRLVLYDVAGRLVRTLAAGPFPAGQHQRVWDGTDDRGRPVAAGVYLARLDAGSVQQRRSIVVIR